MTGLMSLARTFVERIIDKLAQAKREERDRVAEYCHGIAETLSEAYRSLEGGTVPHGLCAQLDRYMHDMRDVLEEVLPRADFDDLRDVLAVAYQVEHIDRELPSPIRTGTTYEELNIAAGKFRAIADKIRATPSRTSP